MIKFISYVRPAVSGQVNRIPVLRTSLKGQRSIHSKEELQQACITWANLNLEFPQYRIHHCRPTCFDYHKSRKMGFRSGFPDLWISLGTGQTGYIFFQYKGSFLTLEQENFRDFLKAEGHKWAVCRSIEDFIQTLAQWGLVSKHKKEKQKATSALFRQFKNVKEENNAEQE